MSAIVTALICIFMKAGMALGGVVPGLVLAWVGFNSGNAVQIPFAEFDITSLVTIIPMTLMVIAAFVISRYELTDNRMNEINSIIESRSYQSDYGIIIKS